MVVREGREGGVKGQGGESKGKIKEEKGESDRRTERGGKNQRKRGSEKGHSSWFGLVLGW